MFPEIKPNVTKDDHGWFSNGNQQMLINDIKDAKIVVELGSWLGKSTRWICDNSKAKVYAIDHWIGSIEHHTTSNMEVKGKLETLYDTFIVNCWDYRDRIVPLRMSTIDGLIEVKEMNIYPDVIYIDASHEYEDVYNDLEYCYKLFPKAVLIGDDWNWKNKRLNRRKTVQEAVLEFVKNYNLKVINNRKSYKIIY